MMSMIRNSMDASPEGHVPTPRQSLRRTYVMCRLHPTPVESGRMSADEPPASASPLLRQWDALRRQYVALGHEVHVIDAKPGDDRLMFAGAMSFTLNGMAYIADTEAQQGGIRSIERWLRCHGFRTLEPMNANDGGDFVVVGDRVLAGFGFHSSRASHSELARTFGREVVSLKLSDEQLPRLDLALSVLDSSAETAEIAYLPSAFDARNLRRLESLFPTAITVEAAEARHNALNCVSDGHRIVVDSRAERFMRDLQSRGFQPVPVEADALVKAGGGIKRCTQELRPGTLDGRLAR